MNTKIIHLREQMKSLNLSGMIITNPINIKYLTGINSQGTLLITRRENIFITYPMYIEEVNSTLTISDEIIVMDGTYISNEEFENFFVFCENVGFEEKYVTYEGYKKIMHRYKANNLVETEGIIEKQRMIKDTEEIMNIKKACEITDKCFEYLLQYIKIGTTEKQVANEIERFYKENGSEGIAFEPIVASGKNTSIPHFKPTDKKIEMADPIIIDMGCKYNGYCSDMTRTIFMGCILEEIKPMYDLILKNHILTINDLRSNTNIKTIVKKVENDFKSNNFNLIHALGHGVGLETHEIPNISESNESFFKENMIIAIEPAIYIPGKYGIRIEDTICINKTDNKVLTKSDTNYIVI